MLESLVKEWLALEDSVQKLDRDLKIAKEARDKVEMKLIEDMDEEGVETIKTDDGTFSLLQTLYASIGRENLEKAKVFFDEKGVLTSLIQEDFKKGRLNEVVKKMITDNEAIPDFIKYYIKRQISKRNTAKKLDN